MFRYVLVSLAAAVLVTASLIPDDALARRGGGSGFRGGGGFHGGGARAGGFHRGGAIHAGRGYRVGGPRPSHPIAGRPGRPGYPIAGRPGRPGYPVAGRGYYRGYGYGAAAVGAAAAGAAYYGSYLHIITATMRTGNWICPGQYPY